MTGAVACCAVAVAACVAALLNSGAADRRLAHVLPTRHSLARTPTQRSVEVPRKLAALLAAAATSLLVSGLGGLVAGAVVGVVTSRLLARLEPAAVRRRRAAVVRDLPVALDLIAACLLAGCDVKSAVDVVMRALGGPIAVEFASVISALDLGIAPADAWLALRSDSLRPVGQTLARAATSGAPLAEIVSGVAEQRRAALQAEASAAARRAVVAAVGPLGACFLPAFIATAVLPVIAGLTSHVLG